MPARRQERAFDVRPTRYDMRQRMLSIAATTTPSTTTAASMRSSWDGKALRVRETILFKDMDGHELCKIEERMLHIRDSMEIEGPDGKRLAMAHKA